MIWMRMLLMMMQMAASYCRKYWPVLFILPSIQLGAVTDPIANKAIAVTPPAAKKMTLETAEPWRSYRKFEQFEMSYRDIKSDGQTMLEIKARFVFKGRLSAFFQVLRDTEHAGKWLDSAHSVRIIESPSPFEDWVHTTFNTPWPLQPRDMVTCSTWQQHIDYSIEMFVIACNDKWPEPPDTVRIKQVNARWILRSLPDHQVQVLYTGTADAGGGLPRWLGDPVALTSSLRSFRALQQQLSLPDYQQIVAEVCEPEFTVAGEFLPSDVKTPACQKLRSLAK